MEKIKIEELMIGNFILSLGYDEDMGGNIIHDELGDEIEIVTHETFKYIVEDSLAVYKPIPLTADWLVKFNFNHTGYKDGYIGKMFGSVVTLDFVLTKPGKLYENQVDYIYELQNHRLVTIRYVHQLQNLFFSITGEQLTLPREEA